MKFSTDIFDSNIARALKLIEKILLIALLAGIVLYDQSNNLLLLQITLGLLCIIYFLFPFLTNTSRFIDIDLDELDNNDTEEEIDVNKFDEQKIDQVPEVQFVFSCFILPKILWLSIALSVAGYLSLITFPNNDTYRKLILVGAGTSVIGLSVLVYEIFKGLKDIKFLYPILLRAIPVVLFDLYLLFSLLK